MMTEQLKGEWEERWHPLRQEWVIVAAHRQNRPWIGETLSHKATEIPAYVDDCYLCPGNPRVSGKKNDNYEGIFVFDNDHPCVGDNAPDVQAPVDSVYQNRAAHGIARVVCYSPRHDLTLAQLRPGEVEKLFVEWQKQYSDLGNLPGIDHVLIFENKGEAVGVSNPHPHCQIYATNFVFKTIETEAKASAEYLARTGKGLLEDVIAAEQRHQRRIIAENEAAIAFIPYFARYAYEVFVAPKKRYPSISSLPENELKDLADILLEVTVRFDNLWQMPFPYVMPLHQAPTDGGDYSGFHFHFEFHPPLRKPNLLKYLAGPEIGGGNFLSDTSPDEKAGELRGVSPTHYLSK